ncbi:MAG: hypothetical protein IT565_07825 [Rhodospirillales bacterium]|nr:hypothetical protein [Rhodospirillales bacterium]
MSPFAEELAGSRRLFILRLLIEAGGSANAGVIRANTTRGGFPLTSHADLAGDLDLLAKRGCTSDEWLHEKLRVVRITPRGEDAAHGRIAVNGVERSLWDRD